MSVLGYAQLLRSPITGTPTKIADSRGVPVAINNVTITSNSFDSTGPGPFKLGYLWIYAFSPAGVPSVTIPLDSYGNAWTLAATFDAYGNGQPWMKLYYCSNLIGGAGHTVTVNFGATARASISIGVWNTPSIYTYDTSNSGFTPSGSNAATNTITPAANNCILTTTNVRFASGTPNTDQPTISGGGWTNGMQNFWTGQVVNTTPACAEYSRLLSVAASNSCTHAWTIAATRAIAAIASFKP